MPEGQRFGVKRVSLTESVRAFITLNAIEITFFELGRTFAY